MKQLPLTPPRKKRTIDIPISLCLIGKNERKNAKILAKSLEGILDHPKDEVIYVDTGSTDNTVEVARKLGWKVFLHPELADGSMGDLLDKYLPDFDRTNPAMRHAHFKGGLMRSFAAARNKSFEYAQNEVCMWLDLDDTLVNPAHLRPTIDQMFKDGVPTCFMLKYEYAQDKEDDACVTSLWRERVVSKSAFVWKGACHEVLVPRDDHGKVRMARADNMPTKVVHRYHKPSCYSDLRNYLIMRQDLDRMHDPRTLYYLGNAARGLGQYVEAVEWYQKFIPQSGSREDVMMALFSMATCYHYLGRHWKAMEPIFQAMRTRPDDPRVYYFLADCWFQLGHYRNCLLNIKLGDQFEMPDTLHAVDPTQLSFQPATLGARAARQLNEPDLAVHFAERAYNERPNLALTQNGLRDAIAWARAQKQAALTLSVVENAKDKMAAMQAVNISPHMLLQGFGSLETEIPDAPGHLDDITFFCGHSADPWGPPAVMRGKGCGASEKMVYEAATALAKKGHKVYVYCALPMNGDEGIHEGVRWCFSGTFNHRLHRKHLVVWRRPQLLASVPFNADHIHVWMHDMGHNSWWNEEILAIMDSVWFLSKWQRDLHPSVPEEKVFYTRNGINLKKHLYDGRAKKKQIVFCSSPDRGFQRAINVFKESGLAKEGYELHLYYGFGKTWSVFAVDHEFGHVVEMEKDMRLFQYQDDCLELAATTPGVVYKGSVDWATMAEALKDAEVWLYPTNFGEISCVAAMEAMAAGCKVVATSSAALAETLKGYPGWYELREGTGTWGEELRRVTLDQVPHPGMWAEHARKFDIETLATQWEGLFNEHREGDSGAEGSCEGA